MHIWPTYTITARTDLGLLSMMLMCQILLAKTVLQVRALRLQRGSAFLLTCAFDITRVHSDNNIRSSEFRGFLLEAP